MATPAPSARTIETMRRLMAIEGMMAHGTHNTYILVEAKRRWGMTPKQTIAFIERVMAMWAVAGERGVRERQLQHAVNIRQWIEKCERAGDFKAVATFVKILAEVEGTLAAQQVNINTGPSPEVIAEFNARAERIIAAVEQRLAEIGRSGEDVAADMRRIRDLAVVGERTAMTLPPGSEIDLDDLDDPRQDDEGDGEPGSPSL